MRLELLSDYEVELASTIALVVESITPVYTEKADHREEDSSSDTCRSLYLERIEVSDI